MREKDVGKDCGERIDILSRNLAFCFLFDFRLWGVSEIFANRFLFAVKYAILAVFTHRSMYQTIAISKEKRGRKKG